MTDEQKAEGWRSMDTAPRDGTHILIAFGSDGVSSAAYSRDDNDPHPWKFLDDQEAGKPIFNGARDDKYGPSGWMPLPKWSPIGSAHLADAVQPAAGEGGMREAAMAVIEAARNMPRRAPAAGGTGTIHMMPIEAGEMWMLDRALLEFDRVQAAALSNSAPAGVVGIKPLVFEMPTCGQDEYEHVAPTSIGTYRVVDVGKKRWLVYLDSLPTANTRHETVDAAKASAQADYEARIRACLITPPAQEPTR